MVHGAFKPSSLLCSTGFRRYLTLNVNERSWYTYDGDHINIILLKCFHALNIVRFAKAK